MPLQAVFCFKKRPRRKAQNSYVLLVIPIGHVASLWRASPRSSLGLLPRPAMPDQVLRAPHIGDSRAAVAVSAFR
jgi:hypothetical protein